MAAYTFAGQAVVADDDILENATGGTFVDDDGNPIPIFDVNDNPIEEITSNKFGQSSVFKANVIGGWIKFGDVLNWAFAKEVGQLAVDAQGAVDIANQAITIANNAIAIAQSGGGGGLPVGTTLDQIQDGLTRLALTLTERQKLATVAQGATALQIGSTSTTAKPGNWVPTPAEIGAVRNMGGADRMWGRVAAQGLPTVAEGALDNDWALVDAS